MDKKFENHPTSTTSAGSADLPQQSLMMTTTNNNGSSSSGSSRSGGNVDNGLRMDSPQTTANKLVGVCSSDTVATNAANDNDHNNNKNRNSHEMSDDDNEGIVLEDSTGCRDKENTDFGSSGSDGSSHMVGELGNSDLTKNDSVRASSNVVTDYDSKTLLTNTDSPTLTASPNKNSNVSINSDDSNNATATSSTNASNSKRDKVEKALAFLEVVRKNFTREPVVYNGFLNLMRSFKSNKPNEDGMSMKEIVDQVKSIFGDKSDLMKHFSEFVIGDKRNEKISGLVDAANYLPSLNVHTGAELSSTIDNKTGLVSTAGGGAHHDGGDGAAIAASTIANNNNTTPSTRKHESAGNDVASGVVGCSTRQTTNNEIPLVRPSAGTNTEHTSNAINSTITSSSSAGSRISVAQNSLNSGHTPRVVSSIQHRPPPVFSSRPPVVVDAGGSLMRPIYSPHAPPMIPQSLPPGFHAFNGYPGSQPPPPPPPTPPINQYGGARRATAVPPHHNNASGNSAPMAGVPRGAGYRNPTPTTNTGPGRRGGPRAPSNFSTLQSALYHNIATNANSGPSPPPAVSSSGVEGANVAPKTLPPPTKRPYNYVSSSGTSIMPKVGPNNEQSAATCGGNSVSSSPILPPNNAGGGLPTQQQNVYYQKCATNMVASSANNNSTTSNNNSNNNNSNIGVPTQFIPDSNSERFSRQTHPTYLIGLEYFDSFDRGAFDFVSAVKMYFTDVLKKPRLYQEFVHHLREYQSQHEMMEMGPAMSIEDKKVNEHGLLKKLMDSVSDLFNQNAELINSFLHYLPSLNSNLSAATLAPYHASLLNKQPSNSGSAASVFAPPPPPPVAAAAHLQQTANSIETKVVNNRPRLLNSQTAAGSSISHNTDPKRYQHPSAFAAANPNLPCGNSSQKAMNTSALGSTGNAAIQPIGSGTVHMANSTMPSTVNKYPAMSSSTIPTPSPSTNSNLPSNVAVAATRGTLSFLPHVNKQGAKLPSMTTTATAASTLRQLPQSRFRIPPYGGRFGVRAVGSHFDPNLILQIFTEIRAVTNVKDYSNILKCINLYNANVIGFTEFLCMIKSITFNNKIAYSKLRLILKSMADLSVEFDTVFPEIIYPGSEMPIKNRTVNRPNMVSSITTVGNNPLLLPSHAIVDHRSGRVVISRQTPKKMSTVTINANYYPGGVPSSALHTNATTNSGSSAGVRAKANSNVVVTARYPNPPANAHKNNPQPPRAQRIVGFGHRNNNVVATGAKVTTVLSNNTASNKTNFAATQLESYTMKKSAKNNAFVASLSATQHARFYLDRNSRISSSYFLLGPSTPKWTCSGRTELANSVINSECLSEAHTAIEENTTPAAFTRNVHEEELTRVEEERFEFDVLFDLFVHVRDYFSEVLADETDSGCVDIFEGDMKYLIYKALQNLYGDNCHKVIKALKVDPLASLRVVFPRFEQKIKEWSISKRHLDEYWRKITLKNYLKASDYRFVPFKSGDIKKLKAKQLIKEIEQISNEAAATADSNVGRGANVATKPHITINYSNQIIVSSATHLIMYHTKRLSALSSEDKAYIDGLMLENFLPKFFNSNLTTIQPGERCFHFFASDDIYVFFRLHNILCERLQKIYDICSDVMKACELYNNSVATFDSNLNLSAVATSTNPTPASSTQCVYHYPFLLSKSIQHRFSSARHPKTLQELYDFFIELVHQMLDGNIDNETFEDECRFMFGTQCYVVFTVDRLIRECVKYLNFMVFNAPSQNLIDLFVKFGPIVVVAHHQHRPTQIIPTYDNAKLFEQYKREMDAIMKPQNYYLDLRFNANHNRSQPTATTTSNGGTQNDYYVSCKIFLYQSFVEENSPPTENQSLTPLPTPVPSSVPVAIEPPHPNADTIAINQINFLSSQRKNSPKQETNTPSEALSIDNNTNNNVNNNNVNNNNVNNNDSVAPLQGSVEPSNNNFQIGSNYPRNILNDVNFDQWKNYANYFVGDESVLPGTSGHDGDDYTMCLKSLNEELNFVRENHIFMVKNLRHSFRRLPKEASQIIGLIKHLYYRDPSRDSVVFDSSKLFDDHIETPADDDANFGDRNPSSGGGGLATAGATTGRPINAATISQNHFRDLHTDIYSNGLLIFDNETYVLEPLIFQVQYVRDSCYFLHNKYSIKRSMKYYNNSASSLPPGAYLESIVCKNRTQSPTNN